MKKIVVLGGSYLQSDFIKTAVNMCEEVYVLDRNENCYASAMDSITFIPIDISDEYRVEKFFLENECDLIVSPAAEIGNRIAAEIASRNGLLYNSLDAVKATTDKWVMRNKLRNSGLREPKFTQLSTLNNVKKSFGFPLIVKPTVGSASRGVTLVEYESELEDAIDYALKYCGSENEILIEEYIEGKQYSIETISSQGEHFIVGVTREYMSSGPNFFARSHVISIADTKKLQDKFQTYINELLNILGVTTGPCHIEVKIKDDDIYLIEAASRSGGLRARLLKAANSSDYNEMIIKAYSGEKIQTIDIKKPENCALVGILMTPHDLEVYLYAKEQGILVSDYFNGKAPELDPKSITDAFGYFFVSNGSDIMNCKLI